MQPAGLQVRSPGTLSVLRESLWYPCVKHRRWRSVALSGLRETSDLAAIENWMVQQAAGPRRRCRQNLGLRMDSTGSLTSSTWA